MTTSTEALPPDALRVLDDLGLAPHGSLPRQPSRTSVLLPVEGRNGDAFLLKWYLPARAGVPYPVGEHPADYSRREAAFYRFLDDTDPDRRDFPAPRIVLVGPGDPPPWLLLEWIDIAAGPPEEVLSLEHVFEVLHCLREVPKDRILGRRSFPLQHWDTISYLDRIRAMYDPALFALGEQRWRQLLLFFDEAVRWTDTREPILVHGEFIDQNLLVDSDGRPWLVDFERIGIGNPDHDLACYWIHTDRNQEWKRKLVLRWFGGRVGGDRIRAEWGVRTTLVYLAIRRLRFGYMTRGDEDPRRAANLALLDAAMAGGPDLFPFA
ncbi:MAG: hypothetical protein Fur0037_09030 [Planctomycetota bacterium]